MYCKKCGKQILEDSKFCESCGAKVGAEIILEGGSFTDPPKFSVPLNSSGKILESPAPFENKMDIFWLVIKNVIAGFKVTFGNTIDYNLPVNVSPEELSAIVAKPFAEIYMQLERTGNLLTIRYDKMFFNVYIDNDKSTFHILSYQSSVIFIFPNRNLDEIVGKGCLAEILWCGFGGYLLAALFMSHWLIAVIIVVVLFLIAFGVHK